MSPLTKLFQGWGHSSTRAAKYVATRSVLNPLLWLSAIITPASFLTALFATGPLLYVLLGLAAAPPLATIVAFVGFAFTNPNRLQSEEFIIQQQWVAAQIGDNRTQEVVTLEGVSASPSANTALTDENDRG